MGTRTPLSTFTGQRGQIRCVTNSHGIVRPNLVESVDFTPKLDLKKIPEWDNEIDALIFNVFSGGSGKIGYDRSNQGQLDAILMDLDPAADFTILNAKKFKPFTSFANLRGLDEKFKGSWLLYGCLAHGNPYTGPVKDSAKQSIDFDYLNGILVNGAAILHTRATSAVAALGLATAPTLTTATTGGFLSPDTYYFRIVAKTANGDSFPSKEVAIHVPTGTSTNTVTVDTPSPAGSILSYDVYGFNRSNGEKFSGNDAGAGTFIFTTLPPSSANSPSNTDTSGVFVAPSDKIFVSKSITLDKAAVFDPATGLGYALVLKNGEVLASMDNPATADDFLVAANGLTFTLQNNPADADYWDIFTFYTP